MKALWYLSSRVLASRRSLGLLILALLTAIRVVDPPPVEELRLRCFDLFQAIQPRRDGLRPVVIVDIDEASLRTYGQWPWPRTLVADLVSRLNELRIAAIGFDVVFSELDRLSPTEAMKYFPDLDPELRARLLELPSNDDVLAKAISHGKVVLGQAGTKSATVATPAAFPETGVAILGPDPRSHLITFPGLLRNVPQLERAAAGRGLFTIATERDGMIRRVPLIMAAQENIEPALAVDLLSVSLGVGSILIRSDSAGVRNIAVGSLDLPTDENGRVWIHFAPHDIGRYISAKDVLQGNASPERFSGKLALIGTSAIGLLDIKTTPVHPAMPGVEVHAQLIEAALTNSLLNAPASAIVFERMASTLTGLLLIVLASIVSAPGLFLIAALIATSFATGSWVLYGKYQMLLDPTFPLIIIFSVYAGLALVGYFREQFERQRIRSAFSQYLSPSLVQELANFPERLVLGGEIRNMTIIFSDVRGFTAISEALGQDPTGLTLLMNRLLTPLTNAIVAHNGTVDKYIGDAVMAFWNAPLENANPESDACYAALDMMKAVSALNREREQESSANGERFLPIRIGIGINSGACIVGNMGSTLRFQYTAMGDTVNLASRLEGQSAFYGVSMLIGARTADVVSGEFALLEVDRIRVKGKQVAETTFTILGGPEVAKSTEFRDLQQHWAMLLGCYRQQKWSEVTALIDSIRPLSDKFGLCNLVTLYRNRAEQFAMNPPPVNWDGVFTAETKRAESN